MSRWLLLTGLAIFLVALASRANASTTCDLASVRRVPVAVDAHRAGSPTFQFSYQHYPIGGPDAPTVIYLPGGPGEGSIADWERPELQEILRDRLGLPDGWNLVFTEPRGVGCNLWPELFDVKGSDDLLSTWHLASDVLAMIRAMGLRNYTLYGHSYGTLLATVIASRAEAGEAPPPRGVILSGVLGSAAQLGGSTLLDGIQAEWQNVRAALSPAVQEALATVPLPLGLTAADWEHFIVNRLYAGHSLEAGRAAPELRDELERLASNDSRDREALLTRIRQLRTEGPFAYGDSLFQTIGCREISDREPDFHFQKGEFTPIPGTHLCNGRTLSNPFDVASWPIRAPIFYVAGSRDPAAPYPGARQHFESQLQAPRFFITNAGGGHDQIGQALGGCRAGFWSAVERQGAGLARALKTCTLPMRLERAPPRR